MAVIVRLHPQRPAAVEEERSTSDRNSGSPESFAMRRSLLNRKGPRFDLARRPPTAGRGDGLLLGHFDSPSRRRYVAAVVQQCKTPLKSLGYSVSSTAWLDLVYGAFRRRPRRPHQILTDERYARPRHD